MKKYIFAGLSCLAIYGAVTAIQAPKTDELSQKSKLRNTEQITTISSADKQPHNPVPANVEKIKLKPEKEHRAFSAVDQKAIQSLQLKFNSGDYFGAMALADTYSLEERNPAFREWLDSQMQILLTTAAWAHLKLGDCSKAISFFRRAEALGRTQEISKGLAYCYRKTGQLYAAEEQLEWFLQQNANDKSVQALYLDVLESLGDFVKSERYLSDIQDSANNSERKDILKQLTRVKSKQLESDYQQTQTSQYFTLSYRRIEHEILSEQVLDLLDAALQEFVVDFGFREPNVQIEVLLYPADKFKNIVPDSPDWAEGLFDGRMRIPVKNSWLQNKNLTALDRILRHELVHALFAQMTDFRQLPPWFDEGIAQRLSCNTSQCTTFSFAPKAGSFLQKNDFLKSYTSYSTVKAGQAYRQSLYLIYAIENHSNRESLKTIISKITAQSSLTSDALLKPTGLTFYELIHKTKTQWDKRISIGARSY
ncbi:MAG: hypothetical protein R3B45_04480 [Bdellovibrionota bacterium]